MSLKNKVILYLINYCSLDNIYDNNLEQHLLDEIIIKKIISIYHSIIENKKIENYIEMRQYIQQEINILPISIKSIINNKLDLICESFIIIVSFYTPSILHYYLYMEFICMFIFIISLAENHWRIRKTILILEYLYYQK